MTGWHIETVTGPVADLLLRPVAGGEGGPVAGSQSEDGGTGSGAAQRPFPGSPGRFVRVVHPEDRALVLGSTQPLSHVDQDRARAGSTAVVRRRSGGGAVLVAPEGVLWVDVGLPAADDLAERDVGRAFWWLGEVWAAALAAAGIGPVEVWRAGLVRTPWSDRVCFAGLGAGEVTVGGAKVVGMSQRRTRAGALFQCAVPVTWDPSELLDLLALDSDVRALGAAELAGAALGVGGDVARRLVPEFLDRLP